VKRGGLRLCEALSCRASLSASAERYTLSRRLGHVQTAAREYAGGGGEWPLGAPRLMGGGGGRRWRRSSTRSPWSAPGPTCGRRCAGPAPCPHSYAHMHTHKRHTDTYKHAHPKRAQSPEHAPRLLAARILR
jgi:hypothetical protein